MEDSVATGGDWINLSSLPDSRFLSLDALCKSWAHLEAAEKAVADQPELRRRVQIQQLSIRYAFVMNWKLLRDTANCRNVAWPMGDSVAIERDRCVQFAKDSGIFVAPKNLDELAKVEGLP